MVKRWRLIVEENPVAFKAEMVEDPAGAHVTHDDYERDIKAKGAEIERLKAERLEIAEKAYWEGCNDGRSEEYALTDCSWEASTIRKELTNG